MAESKRVIWFDHLRMSDIGEVGGKNASLGEMIAQLGVEGVRVPQGFATTASAYREFLAKHAWANASLPRWPSSTSMTWPSWRGSAPKFAAGSSRRRCLGR